MSLGQQIQDVLDYDYSRICECPGVCICSSKAEINALVSKEEQTKANLIAFDEIEEQYAWWYGPFSEGELPEISYEPDRGYSSAPGKFLPQKVKYRCTTVCPVCAAELEQKFSTKYVQNSLSTLEVFKRDYSLAYSGIIEIKTPEKTSKYNALMDAEKEEEEEFYQEDFDPNETMFERRFVDVYGSEFDSSKRVLFPETQSLCSDESSITLSPNDSSITLRSNATSITLHSDSSRSSVSSSERSNASESNSETETEKWSYGSENPLDYSSSAFTDFELKGTQTESEYIPPLDFTSDSNLLSSGPESVIDLTVDSDGFSELV